MAAYLMSPVSLKEKTARENRHVSWKELRQSLRTIFRSACIGTYIGSVPGIGSAIAAFLSYGMAKRKSKHPEEFGKGSLEGLAAAEAGNNAVCGATLIPLLTLGIPGDTVTAVLLGAFLIQGLTPGPNLIQEHTPVVYGVFIALLFANIANLVIASLGVKLFSRVINVPKAILFPVILIVCLAGSYAIDNSLFDVQLMFIFGILGYIMRKNEFPPAPFLIAFVLGPMVEESVRQSFLLSQGSPLIFITRPVSLIFLLLTLFSITSLILKRRKENHTAKADQSAIAAS